LVNVLTAVLALAGNLFYVFVYTRWLKRSTPQNIVIGGAAGALPPIIGWAAVTGGVAVEPIVLFLIIFFWTPPHFWALSLYRVEDYARAGIPMLPVVAGEAETRRQIVIYTLILAPLGVAPWFLGYAGPLYGIAALATGAAMIVLALRVRAERQGHAASKQMFGFSILYLFVLFAVLLADRLWGGLAAQAVSHFAA
ncbi:MAG TPA: heme o synthase, partial [Xanthobacteraceae bacterium]|nr:heme o synthase [Xanthobacteraceae bacterium]